ncbi:hypothetical protein GPK34_11385 [Secundilactobacillus kimchicus]|uniref:Uncharacterized protein n=1 Tax=Secundilactobacillus kimchicus JCM 15530 TaxID=1302272 RepID=A0A0R1HQ35_9LACO|nr:LVIS_2131 family protein [Secundilactobacillus kimchicus]KRK47705.1 hypothetical protein FC96_GL002190 [Secundilactobacillus kimchicus JCM 15530]MBT9672627.1 hypothetical protein [Secundilactobacillus kimchicus]
MKSAWNLVGMGLWLLLLVYLVWMVHDMRVRRLRLLVTEKKSYSSRNVMISVVELVIFLLGLWGMGYATFFQDVSALKQSRVTVAYKYEPLVLETGKNTRNQSFYVRVKTGTGRTPIQYFTYYTAGEKYQVTSNAATVSDGKNPVNVDASAYKWNTAKLKAMDRTHQKAWVGVIETTYKKNFLNGIGLHAGRLANRFTLIRIPDHSFMTHAPLHADNQ